MVAEQSSSDLSAVAAYSTQQLQAAEE